MSRVPHRATRRRSGAGSAPQAAGVDVQQREVQVKERNPLAAARRRQSVRHARHERARRSTRRERRRCDPAAARRRAARCVVRRLRAQQVRGSTRVRRCYAAKWRERGAQPAARCAPAGAAPATFARTWTGLAATPARPSRCRSANPPATARAKPPRETRPLHPRQRRCRFRSPSAARWRWPSAPARGQRPQRCSQATRRGAGRAEAGRVRRGHAPLVVCSPRPRGSRPPAPRQQPLPPPRRLRAAASAAPSARRNGRGDVSSCTCM